MRRSYEDLVRIALWILLTTWILVVVADFLF
jgi:hypothetical protein